MPTYYARNTAIQLSVADLAKTTTASPSISQGPATYEEISANAAEFIKASQDGTLDETPLKDDKASSNLRFLGTHKDMPFLMVRAGEFYFDTNPDKRRNRRPIRTPTPPTPENSQSSVTSVPSPAQDVGSELGANGVVDDRTEDQGQ